MPEKEAPAEKENDIVDSVRDNEDNGTVPSTTSSATSQNTHKTSKSLKKAPMCLRDEIEMVSHTDEGFVGFICKTCGYFEGKMNPIPDQPNDVELEECPMCGEIKAINVSTADRIGILCLKCGYNAGRYLQRASIEKFDELDREIQSIEEKIQSKPKIRKGKK